MDKKHKDILISQRAHLVDNINIRDGLFTQLIAKKLLTQRMVRSIQNGRTYDEQIEALLDRLPTLGSKAFDLFCEALKEDFQEEIINMYLKSDAEENEIHEPPSVQESNGTSTSEESMVDNGQTVSVNKASSQGNGLGQGSRFGQGSGLPKQVAITEEYQQQIFRRSIEPSLAETVIGQNGKPNINHHDARFMYQNVMGNPGLVSNSVYAVQTEPHLTLAEKERLIAQMSPSKMSPLKSSMYGIGDHRIVADSIPSKESLMSSPLLRSFQTEMPPMSSIHHNSPVKIAANPFSFQTLSQSPISTNTLSDQQVRISEGVPSSPVKLMGSIHNQRSLPQYQESEYLPVSPQYQTVDRTIRQLPRFREIVSADGTSERHMVTFPRNVEIDRSYVPSMREELVHERQYASSIPKELVFERPYVTSVTQELIGKGDHNIQSLKRNDSVDTMHKRPYEGGEEINAKRIRENIENIPTSTENLSTRKYLDEQTNQIVSIPIIDNAIIRPSQPSVVVETDRHLELTQHGSLLGAMDDPEIDLTDGPINVKVDHCTRQFYLTHYKQAYKMRSIPRGKALIMNVNEVVGKSARRGTDIDRDNLHNMLCQLHFDVTVYNDDDGLTAKEMVLKLQDFSQHPAHKLGDCMIVCILSHGEEGYIFGADGKKFELDAVFSLFDNTCCEGLRGKPKMFIVQACRGGALDKGIQYYPDEHDGSDARVRQVPSMSDMLICYPTQNGYYAWRNRDRGSWYVEALVHVFMKYAKCEDVCTMLNRVNLLVSKKVSHCPTIEMDQMSQMSEYKSTLRMPHFYLFPGIGGT